MMKVKQTQEKIMKRMIGQTDKKRNSFADTELFWRPLKAKGHRPNKTFI